MYRFFLTKTFKFLNKIFLLLKWFRKIMGRWQTGEMVKSFKICNMPFIKKHLALKSKSAEWASARSGIMGSKRKKIWKFLINE